MQCNLDNETEQLGPSSKKADPIERGLSLVEASIGNMQAADDAVAMHAAQMRAFIGGLAAADLG